MMASFCFALFSFQLDKVDETIIFVIGQSRRNVIVEGFCRWRAMAMDQTNGEMHSGIGEFPLSPLSLTAEDGLRVPSSPVSPPSLWQGAISRKKISGAAGRGKLGGFNPFPFSVFFSLLPMHSCTDTTQTHGHACWQ